MKKINRRLALSSQTLRTLTRDELGRVPGGWVKTGTCATNSCPTACVSCRCDLDSAVSC